MPKSLTTEEIASRFDRAGITLPQAEQDDIRGAYALLAPMLALIREPGIAPQAEPAITFRTEPAITFKPGAA